MCVCVCLTLNLFDSTDRGDVVHLSRPLFTAVVLSPVGHVPQVLTAPEVLMLVTDPSLKEVDREGKGSEVDTHNNEGKRG